jgi:hypothetical protein
MSMAMAAASGIFADVRRVAHVTALVDQERWDLVAVGFILRSVTVTGKNYINDITISSLQRWPDREGVGAARSLRDVKVSDRDRAL